MNIEIIAVRKIVGEVVHFRGIDRTPGSSERGDTVIVEVPLRLAEHLDWELEAGNRPRITVDRVVSRYHGSARMEA